MSSGPPGSPAAEAPDWNSLTRLVSSSPAMATSRTAVVAACPAGARPAASSPGLRAKGPGGVSWMARRMVSGSSLDSRRSTWATCEGSGRFSARLRCARPSRCASLPGACSAIVRASSTRCRRASTALAGSTSGKNVRTAPSGTECDGRERLVEQRGRLGVEHVDSGQPDALAGQPLDMTDHFRHGNIGDRRGDKGGAAAAGIADRRYQAVDVSRGDQGRPGGQDHLAVAGLRRRQDRPDHMRDPGPPCVRGVDVPDEALIRRRRSGRRRRRVDIDPDPVVLPAVTVHGHGRHPVPRG